MKIDVKNIGQYLRHMENLNAISKLCGGKTSTEADKYSYGEYLYAKLRRIERRASKLNEIDCNVGRTEGKSAETNKQIVRSIKKLFNGKMPEGFYLNGDPRGYALKIDNPREHYPNINLYSDMGGYGILAPDFS